MIRWVLTFDVTPHLFVCRAARRRFELGNAAPSNQKEHHTLSIMNPMTCNRCSFHDAAPHDNIEKLPSGCFAILVHRHYLERVKDVMMSNEFNIQRSWTNISTTAEANDINNDDDDDDMINDAKRFKNEVAVNNGDIQAIHSPSCQEIDSLQQQNLKGGRKDRRGYQLLLFQHSYVTSLMELSPLARQNISWAAPIRYRISYPAVECPPITPVNINHIGVDLFRLLKQFEFDIHKHLLRIDVFPPEQGEHIAKALQMAAVAFLSESTELEASSLNDDDPFSGPIELTRSVSKCSHVLTVVKVTTSPSNHATELHNSQHPNHGYYINVALQADHISLLLNHQAAEQAWVEPTDEKTGLDLGQNVPPHAPVSRAYYKLLQVWQEYLKPRHPLPSFPTVTAPTTVGLDLGASPGGWTQVMLEHFRLSHVIAVDTARHLAHRIVGHPLTSGRVTHVQADLSQKVDTARAIYEAMPLSADSQPHSSISHVVCDSSTDSNRILPDVVQLIENLSLLPSISWTRPSYWVVTLKLPYKTSQSVQRNIERVMQTIPEHLRHAASFCYRDQKAVEIEYQVVHLMANSDSERTLIAILR